VAPIAILFGVLLTALGGGLYAASESKSITALIPSFFGLALIVLGIIARLGGEGARKHTMHVAALLGLVGLVFPAYRVIRALAGGAEVNLAIGGQIAMAVLCGVFLVLCVKSFIDARRARKARETQPTP
jgi:hypothetical protein